MNRKLFWFGAIFQIFNLAILGLGMMTFILLKFITTPLMAGIFVYAVLNIASIFCMVIGLLEK